MTDNKKDIFGLPACNGRFGEIAALAPQKRQCEFGSYYPARTFVKPLPRQAAGTLGVSKLGVRILNILPNFLLVSVDFYSALVEK
jgi:hypothetical protein